MASKTGGATGWFKCNDWGISAKPPGTYMLRFMRSVGDYFGVMLLAKQKYDSTASHYGLLNHATDQDSVEIGMNLRHSQTIETTTATNNLRHRNSDQLEYDDQPRFSRNTLELLGNQRESYAQMAWTRDRSESHGDDLFSDTNVKWARKYL